jgi:hypothetical protein
MTPSGVIEPSGNVFAGDRFRHPPVANFPALRRHLDRPVGDDDGWGGRSDFLDEAAALGVLVGDLTRTAVSTARDLPVAMLTARSATETSQRERSHSVAHRRSTGRALCHEGSGRFAQPGCAILLPALARLTLRVYATVGPESGVAPGGVLLWRSGDLIDDQLRANRAVGVGRRSGETDPLFAATSTGLEMRARPRSRRPSEQSPNTRVVAAGVPASHRYGKYPHMRALTDGAARMLPLRGSLLIRWPQVRILPGAWAEVPTTGSHELRRAGRIRGLGRDRGLERSA